MNKATASLALVFGIILGFGGGCTEDASPGGVGAGGTGNDASAAWLHNACHGCFASRCSAEMTACGTDPTCAVFAECIEACPADADGIPSASCVQSCPGASEASAVSACLSKAEAECTECGGSGDSGVCAPDLLCQECGSSVETNPCWKCQDERCCDSDQACREDQGCFDYFHCLQTCAGNSRSRVDCVAECDASVGAENFVKYKAKETCAMMRCLEPTECGNEPVDRCIGCVNDKCAPEQVACQTNDQCARMALCVQDCTSSDCYDACFSQFAGGLDLMLKQADCMEARCDDPRSE